MIEALYVKLSSLAILTYLCDKPLVNPFELLWACSFFLLL